MAEIGITQVLLLTNPSHRKTYEEWAESKGFTPQTYESSHTRPRQGVKVVAYQGPTDPLSVYFNGISTMMGTSHILTVADDNIFDFSLHGLVETLEQADDNVVTAMPTGRLRIDGDLSRCNFGMLTAGRDGKVLEAGYSFGPNSTIGDLVILDIYLTHAKRVTYFLEFLKSPESMKRAQAEWWKHHYAWIPPEDGFWADTGKPEMRSGIKEHYRKVLKQSELDL
ncbi:hypothetical protein JW868_04510 [Candidatus Woesearchaeota archaeon]|nr:hypothetical protein [Candidatus Woesearchaeota archaeon]